MIKKVKNWYNNLLSFQKTRFWKHLIASISTVLFLFLVYIRYTLPEFLLSLTLYPIFFYLGICAFLDIFLNSGDYAHSEEITYKLKKMYKDAEDKINVWFDSACSDCVKVNIKSTENSTELSEILAYYHNKHLLVNSFYVERKKSILDKETIYCIYAKCEGKQDKIVFPDKITNAGYILAIFTPVN